MAVDSNEYLEHLKGSNITALQELIKGREQHCCAVVKTAKPVRRSGGVDYVLSLTITDPTIGWDNALSVNLFAPKESAFAHVSTGDLIVFHSLLINDFQGKKQCRNIKGRTTWAVIDKTTLKPRENDIIKLEVTQAEQLAVEQLHEWAQENGAAEDTSSNNALSRYRITITTEQIEAHKGFFDYLGEIVSWHRIDSATKAVMFVTDYTKNPHPPQGEWFEQTIGSDRLLPITLYDEHVVRCAPLQPGDFVFIENLKAKMSQNGTLEAVLSGAKYSFGSSKVSKIGMENVHVKPMVERKEKYLDDLKKKSSLNSSAIPEVKPKQIISVVTDLKRKFTSISDVLNDNAIPSLYKVHAKVIDCKPHEVKEWVQKWCPICDNSYPLSKGQCSVCHTPIDCYTLQGALYVEDSHQHRMILYVYGEDSQQLFADFAPAEPTQEYIDGLKTRLQKICSVDERLALGVKSYVVPERGRSYRITNTIISFC